MDDGKDPGVSSDSEHDRYEALCREPNPTVSTEQFAGGVSGAVHVHYVHVIVHVHVYTLCTCVGGVLRAAHVHYVHVVVHVHLHCVHACTLGIMNTLICAVILLIMPHSSEPTIN